jgi:UV excision repair protein RAD23
MKITVKTIKGELIPLEVEPTNTVLEVKERLQAAKGFEVAGQKLILKGKQTSDNETLGQLEIKEGDFMVVMVSKAKAPAPSQPLGGSQDVPSNISSQTTQPVQQSQPVSVASNATTWNDPSSSLLTGDSLNKTVDEICAMGFEKPKVIEALKAAFNNPDRAIEYLFNGIPTNIAGTLPTLPPTGNAPQGGGTTLPSPGTQAPEGGADPNNPIAFLAASPLFQQLRAVIQTNPNLLQPALAQLAQTQPQIFQLITQNQEAFLKLLMEGAEGMEEEGGQANVISVTPEEKAAIDRLASLGFDRGLAAEAYLACDKNEELAANYLLERQMAGDLESPAGGFAGGNEEDDDEEGDYEDENFFSQ